MIARYGWPVPRSFDLRLSDWCLLALRGTVFEVGLFIDQWAGYVSMLRALIIVLLIRFRCWFRACRVLHERDGTDLLLTHY